MRGFIAGRGIVVMLAVLLVATLTPVAAFAATPDTVEPQQAADRSSTGLARLGEIDFSEHLAGVSVEVADGPGISARSPYLQNTPNASVGLGRYIYIRFSPREQRLVISVGSAAVAMLVCAVSGGTACAVAGFAAATIGYWVAYFYNPSCWIEIKMTYWGTYAGGNSCWKRA